MRTPSFLTLISPILLLSGFILFLFTTPIQANSLSSGTVLGIDFANMPLGTEAHYRGSNGDTWIRKYKRKFGKFYIVENIYKGKVTYRLYYNEDGTLHRRVYSNGNVRTFMPRRCMRVIGECFFETTNTKPKPVTTKDRGFLQKKGAWFTYEFGDAERKKVRTFKYKLGEYNLITRGKSGDFSERLVKVVKP